MHGDLLFSAIKDSDLTGYLEVLSREDFDLFEYSSLPTDKLRSECYRALRQALTNESTLSLQLKCGGTIVAGIVLEFLGFDSHILNMKSYRISNLFINKYYLSHDADIISKFLTRLKDILNKAKVEYVTASINSNHSQSNDRMNLLIRDGFSFIGFLVSFKADQQDYQKIRYSDPKSDGISIRLSKPSDKDLIGILARNSYKLSRYHLDERLDRDLCDRLYSQSVVNAIDHDFADITLIAEYEGKPVGYYTARKVSYPDLAVTVGYGLLTAVDPEIRGKGVYQLLNNRILEWYEENTDISEMGCYIGNIPIHRTFTSNGLQIIRGLYQLALFSK